MLSLVYIEIFDIVTTKSGMLYDLIEKWHVIMT